MSELLPKDRRHHSVQIGLLVIAIVLGGMALVIATSASAPASDAYGASASYDPRDLFGKPDWDAMKRAGQKFDDGKSDVACPAGEECGP